MSANDRAIFRELKRAAARTPPWHAGSPEYAYIVDLAHEAGVEVSEAAPVLIAVNRATPGGIFKRIDMVAMADARKLRQSQIETGVFGGEELVNIEKMAKAKAPALEPNGSGYYVWVMGRGEEPLDEPAVGPHPLESAKTYARIAATKGVHDRAVSRGTDPLASSFRIVRRYRAGTGERIL